MLSMSDDNRELAKAILDNILWALDQITKRFKEINTAADFIETDRGLEKLDAICMQLINIGEALKQFDKITEKELLQKYPERECKKVMGMRDIITHHYFDIDSETVFTVCDEHIFELETVFRQIKMDLSEKS